MRQPLHPDTEELVKSVMLALAMKLLKAQEKYGYDNDWLTADWETECRGQLLKHIEKGDPLDVIAYAAFMWKRGWTTNDSSI